MKPMLLVLGIIVAAAGAAVIAGNLLQLGPPTPNSVKYLELQFPETTLPHTWNGTLVAGGTNLVLEIRAWGEAVGTVQVAGHVNCEGDPQLRTGPETIYIGTSPAWYYVRMARTNVDKGDECVIDLQSWYTTTVHVDALILWGYAPAEGPPASEDVTPPPPPGTAPQEGRKDAGPPPGGPADLGRLGWILGGAILLLVGLLLAAVGLA